MSLIDTKEMELIKKISDRIHETYRVEDTLSPYAKGIVKESYWEVRQGEQKEFEIVSYNFSNPKELQHVLSQFMKEDFKKDFMLPVIVATFKQHRNIVEKGDVSSYIYEF